MLLRMAFRAICHHTVRSLLTLIGIVIGIAGIITISAIGKGAQKKARDQFLAYGSKTINISTYNWMTPSKKDPKPFSLDYLSVITSLCPAVQYISPEIYQNRVSIEYEGKESTGELMGTNEHGLQIYGRTMHSGIYFNQQHIAQKDNVLVLTPEMAELFFKLRNPLGQVIRVNRIPFTVIGILDPPKVKGRFDGLRPPPALVPFTSLQKSFGTKIYDLVLSTHTDEQVAQVTRQLEKTLRASHALQDGETNDFMIRDNQTFAAAAEEASKSVGLFSLIAAIIALLVGGIGVMNIMLVAVQERTKEIGIKAALGATMNFIRTQFLIEAVIICMVGGVLGIVFGVAAAYILNHWFGIKAIIDLTPIIVSFLCTVLIGIVFGFYPAEMAARLNPVEALTEY